MKRTLLCIALVVLCLNALASAPSLRSDSLLRHWKFSQIDAGNAKNIDFIDENWEDVTIPHDWAIAGPFSRNYDLQKVAVKQNGESVATWKTGRTGGLPYIGTGWYRTHFPTPSAHKTCVLLFDGAMSEASVYVNGERAIMWPYGYNSFYVDVTRLLRHDGAQNLLAVRLQNLPESSRWYPGAGLYRNVHLITTNTTHVDVWGTQITTPLVNTEEATVYINTSIAGTSKYKIIIDTEIWDEENQKVASSSDFSSPSYKDENIIVKQAVTVKNPHLWSPESPYLYRAINRIYENGELVDTFQTRFGIRSVEFRPHEGMFLNGKPYKFRGVCLHHDLGPLGSAVDKGALRHQLLMLKDMGCNAIRTSHNMPDPQQVELCDEMGLFVMIEAFDEWDVAKCRNGYSRWFFETAEQKYGMITPWADKDIRNMVRHYRSNPSVVMWSIGNEVPSQGNRLGIEVATKLQEICHEEDDTRPVTCGMDQVRTVIKNGFAAALDIPGFNYRTQYYQQGYDSLPQKLILGSETASTVSSRGTYMFPMKLGKGVLHDNHQSSGYDTEACSWSNVPDEDFRLSDDNPWCLGQFVWTGFDYLGEPSPYDTDAWPSHSSLFGIIDLASLPKDRYYLYQSQWRKDQEMLHVLPHWTWEGREGELTPIMAYSTYNSANLYVNGKFHGTARKLSPEESEALKGKDPLWLLKRYRLIWDDVVYQPGEIRVDALDSEGNVAKSVTIKTSGKPHHVSLQRSYPVDSDNLQYITVSICDKDGNLCPMDTSEITFDIKGAGTFRAAANGDATCLVPFQSKTQKAFAGQLTLIVERKSKGKIKVVAKSAALKTGTLSF